MLISSADTVRTTDQGSPLTFAGSAVGVVPGRGTYLARSAPSRDYDPCSEGGRGDRALTRRSTGSQPERPTRANRDAHEGRVPPVLPLTGYRYIAP
jgi:hypothetical protein